ncbi:MAG: PIN domain-containing protein [Cytophagales bacterium]|nr:PIN domain-containing protein [Cytophagales bacterium]
MFTNNSIFIDSSVLIEYRKGTKTDLLEYIFDNNFTPVIGQPVVSEFLYHNLAIFSGKSPLAVKSSGQIKPIISQSDHMGFLGLFKFIPDDENILNDVVELMGQYNLLPNDGIILALCKHHQIKKLASFDSDFILACEKVGIALVSEISHLQ